MYYVLFNYIKKHGKGWLPFSIESKVIEFLHESYEDIEVVQIIEVCAEYRLGLVVTEDYVKSVLELEKGVESLVELGKKPEEIIKENKKTLEELEDGEPSAMSKIGQDIEEEIEEETAKEKLKKILGRGDKAIAAAEKSLKKKEDWSLCTQCKKHHIAPWNKKRICSICQNERKTTRPYTRSKEFSGL